MMETQKQKSEAKNAKNKRFDFKKAFAELEELGEWFSREEIDLNEAMDKYEKGVKLVKEIELHLKNKENELKRVK